MARRKEAHGGGHGWFVTFADLMGLLVSFFVMLVAFSNQDQQKLQIVAGSMRDAFGVQTNVRYSGIIEVNGLPTRPKLKNAAHITPEEASATPTPDEHDNQREYGAKFKNDRAFALAAASLRQALQEMPDLTEVSKHIMIEETKQGLNIEIVDQDGRSMFAEGSKEPYERTRKIIQKIAVPLEADAVPAFHHRPHLRQQDASAGELRPMEPVRRPRQLRAPNSGRGRHAAGQLLRGRWQGRHGSAISRRSLYRGQSPRNYHADARRAAGSPRPQAVDHTSGADIKRAKVRPYCRWACDAIKAPFLWLFGRRQQHL